MKPETEGKAGHTAVPWFVGKDKAGCATVMQYDDDPHPRFEIASHLRHEDAVFICAAVNTHEDLVELAKDALFRGYSGIYNEDDLKALIARAEAQ